MLKINLKKLGNPTHKAPANASSWVSQCSCHWSCNVQVSSGRKAFRKKEKNVQDITMVPELEVTNKSISVCISIPTIILQKVNPEFFLILTQNIHLTIIFLQKNVNQLNTIHHTNLLQLIYISDQLITKIFCPPRNLDKRPWQNLPDVASINRSNINFHLAE